MKMCERTNHEKARITTCTTARARATNMFGVPSSGDEQEHEQRRQRLNKSNVCRPCARSHSRRTTSICAKQGSRGLLELQRRGASGNSHKAEVHRFFAVLKEAPLAPGLRKRRRAKYRSRQDLHTFLPLLHFPVHSRPRVSVYVPVPCCIPSSHSPS